MEVDTVYEENILSKIGKEKSKQVLTDSKPVLKTVVKTIAKPVVKPVSTGLEEELQSIPDNKELPSIRLKPVVQQEKLVPGQEINRKLETKTNIKLKKTYGISFFNPAKIC